MGCFMSLQDINIICFIYIYIWIIIAEYTRSALDRPPLPDKPLFYKLSNKGPKRAKTLSRHKLHQPIYNKTDPNLQERQSFYPPELQVPSDESKAFERYLHQFPF